MASFNKVVLVGNMTRDPEFRTIANGTPVVEVGLAVNERRRDAGGNAVEETSFFDVTVWSRNAEIIRDYTRKGSPLLVEGRLKQDVWEQPDGQKRSKIKIIAERVVLLGSRDGASSGGGYQQGGYSQGGYQQQQREQRFQGAPQSVDEYSQDSGEDIPF